jgi:hypothetical protein
MLQISDRGRLMPPSPIRKLVPYAEAAKKKHGANYFRANDIKCSTIDSYSSKKAMIEGNVTSSKNWY